MSLTEKTIVDQIEVTETNHIQVRTATIIKKDEVELTRTFNRCAFYPGSDVSNENPKVQAIANAIWTEEVIAEYLVSQTNGIN